MKINLNKGVIFTMDALIALSIFLLSLILFFSFFKIDPIFGIRGTNIYVKTDSTLFVAEASDTLSEIFRLYQLGHRDQAQALFNSLEFEYPTNVELYLLNNTKFDLILKRGENKFIERLQFSRFLVFTINRSIPHLGMNVNVSAPSSMPGRIIPIKVSIYNPTSSDLVNAQIQLFIFYQDNTQLSWYVENNPRNLTLPVGVWTNQIFNVSIPSDALSDQYYAKVRVTHPQYINEGTDPFNIISFGLIKAESGLIE